MKIKVDESFGTKLKIVNIVATGRFPMELDIVKIYKEVDFPKKEYEPETYPALSVKVEVNGNLRHVTLYRTGKYIITGATSEKDVNDTFTIIFNILKEHGYLK
jgi:transcription initiation factor TFIID TATA-box-binding protein